MSSTDKENAPEISLSTSVISLGEIKTKFKKDIIIENTGNSDLIIRDVKTSNPVYGIVANNTKIKPGEKSKIVISCDPSQSISNVMNSNITIISNDPTNSIKVVKVRGYSK